METSGIAHKIAHWLLRWFLFVVIICLGSSYVIQYFTRPAGTNSAHKRVPTGPPANEARFHAAMNAGDEAFRAGEYNQALQHYLEAEHSAGTLTSEQYDQLKNARLQIVHIFEQGESSSTQKLYRALADCALHQGRELFRGSEYNDAIARAQEAEEFSSHLGEDRSQILQASLYLSAGGLEGLHRYSEAIEANQRVIDYLNAAPGDNEAALSVGYENLASIYLDAQDWPNSLQALTKLIERYDGLLTDHLSVQHMSARSPLVFPMIQSRDRAKSNLVVVYYFSGDTDKALSKAEDFYHDPATYQPRYFASIALDIAIKAQREDAIERWRGRGGFNYGIVRVVALHPPDIR